MGAIGLTPIMQNASKDTKRLGPTDWEDPNHVFKKNV